MTRCSSATTRRRCSSSWSRRTCSSSPSTTSAAGSATTVSSGRCFRPSSSYASLSLPQFSTAGRLRGLRRTANWSSRSTTQPQPATRTSSPGSLLHGRFRTTAAAASPLSSAGLRCSTIRRCSSGTPRSRCSGFGCTRCGADPTPPSIGRWLSRLPSSRAPCPMGAPSRPGRQRFAPCSAGRASSRCSSTPSWRCLAFPQRARGAPSPSFCKGWGCCSRETSTEQRSSWIRLPRWPASKEGYSPVSWRAPSWRSSRWSEVTSPQRSRSSPWPARSSTT